MTIYAHGLTTHGYTDSTVVNAAAANIEAHADIENVSVVINLPELNIVGWEITSVNTYSGDNHDFLLLITHLLLVEGYIFTGYVMPWIDT